jgi:hypothetical protein
MADLTIKLTFSDDNGAKDGSSSDSDNTGYAIYRREGADPGNDALYRIHTNNNPTPGVGTITYEDSDVSVDKSYFYRIENIRGSETALGPLIGPINAPNLTGLGYPGNTPSHTDGVTNYISTEPLIHYDAWKEMALHGEDYKYLPGEYIKNQPNTYKSLNMLFQNGGVHMGLDGTTPELGPHHTSGVTGSFPRIDGPSFSNWCAQIKAARGIDSDFHGRLILDKGATFVLVHPSRSSHPLARTFDDAGQWYAGNWMQAKIPGRTYWGGDNRLKPTNPAVKNHRSVQFSNGNFWSDPDPFMGNSDPNDSAWYPRSTTIMDYDTYYNFGFFNLGGPENGIIPSCIANYGTGSRDYYRDEHVGSIMDLYGTPYIIQHKDHPYISIDAGRINIFIKRIYPNGSYDFYINGMLRDTNAGPHTSTALPQAFKGEDYKAIITDDNGTKFPFGTDSDWYWWSRMQGVSEDMKLLVPPQLGLSTTRSYSPSETYGFVTSPSHIHPIPIQREQAGGNFFNELMLIPSDLTETPGDFTRLVNYLNSKYQGSSNFATQGDYDER